MRQIVDEAMRGARDVMDEVMKGLADDNKLAERELLQRYTRQHEGNPRATALFVIQNMPPGADPMKEFRRYETQMEGLRKRYGVTRGSKQTGGINAY